MFMPQGCVICFVFLSGVSCLLFFCLMFHAWCLISGVLCLVSHVWYLMSGVLCLMSFVSGVLCVIQYVSCLLTVVLCLLSESLWVSLSCVWMLHHLSCLVVHCFLFFCQYYHLQVLSYFVLCPFYHVLCVVYIIRQLFLIQCLWSYVRFL